MAMLGRRDWVQADLRCLMCGRIAGALIGPLPSDENARRALAGRPPKFSAFRSADATPSVTRLVGREQFRCPTCGGGVIMDEVETFSTYADVDDDVEARPRRGRPPKPWRPASAAPTWLDQFDIAG